MAKCDVCGKEFKNERGVKIHKSKVHTSEDTKEESKEEKTVQVCPECGSPRLEYASMDTRSTKTITGLGAPEVYYCKDCGYEGSVKLEMPINQLEEKDIDKIKRRTTDKSYKKKRKPDVLKPIFSTVIVLFLVAAVFTALSGVGRSNTLDKTSKIGYPQYTSNFSTQEKGGEDRQIVSEGPENQTGLQMVSRGSGIGKTTSFLFPIFIIFLFLGLFSYMIWTYGYRIQHFQ